MPGAMPKVLRKIKSISRIPLIAGGLIADKEDVMGALLAGASAVSTSRQDVGNVVRGAAGESPKDWDKGKRTARGKKVGGSYDGKVYYGAGCRYDEQPVHFV